MPDDAWVAQELLKVRSRHLAETAVRKLALGKVDEAREALRTALRYLDEVKVMERMP